MCVCVGGERQITKVRLTERMAGFIWLYCVGARQRLEDSREADDRGWQAFQARDGRKNKCFQFGEGVIIGREKKKRMNKGGGSCPGLL